MDEASGTGPGRLRAGALICLGVLGMLTTWFSATAIVPDLIEEWAMTPAQAAWLTNAVQLGFVAGAVLAALVNLPDIVRMTRLVAIAGLVAALANAALLVTGPGGAIAARFATGMALACVYPPALKLMATWFVRGRGLAMGAMIAALTLGSAAPHLVRALTDGVDWRAVVWATSLAAGAGALLFAGLVREGPHGFARATFDPRRAGAIFTDRALLLANIGYFGHMWELYAMWAWILAFAAAVETAGLAPFPFGSASMLAFWVVAAGAVGCLAGGWLSDRIGRCRTTAGMMAASGACALLMGAVFDGPPLALALVALLWGITVIGDSAQFSAAVTELADRAFVGTALTLQLGIGYALTVLAIWIVPLAAEAMGGWRWAFLVLVPGPVVGAAAMLSLRRRPEAAALAGGAR
ncbi:sugar phosphate permease [Palleronia aestuarii]|uniref:Sugar phosphate permease n=1 Tax=Palleronia aestuarii TaxID=568105 RepID=A0A2W7MYB4_9RHOB|nr:MFS transporter [Palleronia aestuarii]PZX13095.1 sugar phosphate permease [Palleronia aestuarii]